MTSTMIRRLLPFVLCIPAALIVFQPAPRATARPALRSFTAGLPLWFEENRGQADPSIRYLARGPASRLGLAVSGQAVLYLPGAAVRLDLVGATPSSPQALDPLGSHSSYLLGNDPSRWVTGARHYRRIRYPQVYPGIDHVFYGNQRQIEHDFVVAPGADPRRIRLRFEGASRPRIDPSGDLLLDTAAGPLVQRRPIAYQEIDGRRASIGARHVVTPGGDVTFELGAYHPSYPLVIDPIVAGTYLGGAGDDRGFGVAVDIFGYVYLAGLTNSTDFPTTTGSRQPALGGSPSDAFVAKFDPDLTSLIYCTFLGGNNTDVAQRIVADESGNAYVAGYTNSPNFPVSGGTSTIQGQVDLFFAKLDPTGRTLVYSTLVGGGSVELPFALDVDPEGNLYAGGYTQSNNFPTTTGAYDTTFNGGEDGFVLKLNPAGSQLLFSTYLGGSGNERVRGLSWTTTRQVYATGTTFSPNFPVPANALQNALRGTSDAFLTRLNPGGTALEFSTYYGGSGTEEVWGLTWASSGQVAIGGYTSSTDFPNAPGKPALTYNGGPNDGFAVIFGPQPSAAAVEDTPAPAQQDAGDLIVEGARLWGTPNDDQVFAFESRRIEELPVSRFNLALLVAGGRQPDRGRGFVGQLAVEGAGTWNPTYFGNVSTNGIQIDGYGRAHLAHAVDAGNSLDLAGIDAAFQNRPPGGNNAAAAIYGFDATAGVVNTITTRSEASHEAFFLKLPPFFGNRPRPGAAFPLTRAQVTPAHPGLRFETLYWRDRSQPNAPDAPCTAPAGQTCVNRVGFPYGSGVSQNRNRFFFFDDNKVVFSHPLGADVEIGGLKRGAVGGEEFRASFFPIASGGTRRDRNFFFFTSEPRDRPGLLTNLFGPPRIPCRDHNSTLFRNPATGAGTESFRINFVPLAAGAFRNRDGESLPGLRAGSGTRLRALFGNVPPTVRIFVGNRPANNPDAAARTQADALGAGSFSLISGSISPINLDPNGNGNATWEILGSDVNGPLQFPIFVAFDGEPGAKEFTIRTSYAPLGSGASTSFPTFDPNSATTFSVQIPGCSAPPLVSSVSAASFVPGGPLASESIVAAFGTGLSLTTESAARLPLPTTLAGTSLRVKDSTGTERLAPLFYVSPTQINYLVPPGTFPGAADITVNQGDFVVGYGNTRIERIAPGLFTANSSGQGAPAAVAVRVASDGSQTIVPVATFQSGSTPGFIPVPLDLGGPGDQMVLTLYGTGIRGRSSPAGVGATIGGENATVLFAGPQGGFEGLDQVNVAIPRSLAGRGIVDLVTTVDGRPANTVTISIR